MHARSPPCLSRVAKRVEEEKIDPVLVLAMRNMYQSQMGRLMFRSGVYNKLKALSESKGRYMDSPESVKVRHRGG